MHKRRSKQHAIRLNYAAFLAQFDGSRKAARYKIGAHVHSKGHRPGHPGHSCGRDTCMVVGEIKSDNFVPINLSMGRLPRRHLRANPHAARLFGSNAINLSTAELHCVRQMNLSPALDAARIQGSAQVGAGDRPASMAGQRPDVYRTVEPNGLRQLAQRNGASSKRAVSRYGVQCPQDEQPSARGSRCIGHW